LHWKTLLRSIRRTAETSASELKRRCFDALDSFATFPQFGVETDEVGVHRWPIKEFHYTIFYRVGWKKEIIEVVRIMDARRVRDLKRVPR
jgi:plasmid stabilization system protein ParE